MSPKEGVGASEDIASSAVELESGCFLLAASLRLGDKQDATRIGVHEFLKSVYVKWFSEFDPIPNHGGTLGLLNLVGATDLTWQGSPWEYEPKRVGDPSFTRFPNGGIAFNGLSCQRGRLFAEGEYGFYFDETGFLSDSPVVAGVLPSNIWGVEILCDEPRWSRRSGKLNPIEILLHGAEGQDALLIQADWEFDDEGREWWLHGDDLALVLPSLAAADALEWRGDRSSWSSTLVRQEADG